MAKITLTIEDVKGEGGIPAVNFVTNTVDMTEEEKAGLQTLGIQFADKVVAFGYQLLVTAMPEATVLNPQTGKRELLRDFLDSLNVETEDETYGEMKYE